MARYYRLASTELIPGFNNDFPYPYTAFLSFNSVSGPAAFHEGQGHYFAGGVTSLATLAGRESFLAACQGEWLVPYIERMMRGENVESDVLEEYRKRYGGEPVFYDWGND